MFLELKWGTLYKLDMYTGALLVSALNIKTILLCSPVTCEGSVFLSYSVSGQWLDFFFFLEGLAFRFFLVDNLTFSESITTAAPHYGCVVNMGFNVGIEEKL